MIADEKGPIGVAGVMGGLDSEIDEGTQTVALEAAVFEPTMIRKTAQRHNLHTDAAQHFERGVNRGGVEEALDAAAQMINELAGGEVTSGILTAANAPVENESVTVTLSRINHVIGTDMSAMTSRQFLNDSASVFNLLMTYLRSPFHLVVGTSILKPT